MSFVSLFLSSFLFPFLFPFLLLLLPSFLPSFFLSFFKILGAFFVFLSCLVIGRRFEHMPPPLSPPLFIATFTHSDYGQDRWHVVYLCISTEIVELFCNEALVFVSLFTKNEKQETQKKRRRRQWKSSLVLGLSMATVARSASIIDIIRSCAAHGRLLRH